MTSDLIPTLGQLNRGRLRIIDSLCFTFLAIFQGLSNQLWQATAYRAQHDIRMDATQSLMSMEASYFETRQTGNLMSVLSADVAQLEDIISMPVPASLESQSLFNCFCDNVLDVSQACCDSIHASSHHSSHGGMVLYKGTAQVSKAEREYWGIVAILENVLRNYCRAGLQCKGVREI